MNNDQICMCIYTHLAGGSRTVVRIWSKYLRAYGYSHSQGILHRLETRSGCNISDQGIPGKKVCGCFDPKCWDWDAASSQSASLLSPNSPIKLSMDILIVPPSRYASHCLIYP